MQAFMAAKRRQSKVNDRYRCPSESLRRIFPGKCFGRLHSSLFFFNGQCFETGDEVEQFLVDATLAQTME
jgi:hypothetical protein